MVEIDYTSFDDFGFRVAGAYHGLSASSFLSLCATFLSACFFVPALLTPLPYNGMCFDWCSAGKSGIVWTGSGPRSADRWAGWLRAVLELPASSLF